MWTRNETRILEQLDRIARSFRVAFAASCTERLFPTYLNFTKKISLGDPEFLRSALDEIWSTIEGQQPRRVDLESMVDRCMELIPDDHEEGWTIDRAFAENAASAVAYTLRTLLTGSSQDAVWASRCVYEALDSYITTSLEIDWNRNGAEEKILLSPAMQQELRRQNQDLTDLLENSKMVETGRVIRLLRQRSRQQSNSLFEVDDCSHGESNTNGARSLTNGGIFPNRLYRPPGDER